jgi:hypothetical protein
MSKAIFGGFDFFVVGHFSKPLTTKATKETFETPLPSWYLVPFVVDAFRETHREMGALRARAPPESRRDHPLSRI